MKTLDTKMPVSLSVAEARTLILGHAHRMPAEEVRIDAALGRHLADAVICPENVPPFDNSAMDGYAVRSSDTTAASESDPEVLALVEEIPAGHAPQRTVGPGQAARIFTGSMMPAGADAVVIQENTRRPTQQEVAILKPAQPGDNIRRAGEDLRQGEEVLAAGRRLSAADIGLYVSIGLGQARVHRTPRVAILSTGDELVEPGRPLGPGQIRNSNAYVLEAMCRQLGVTAKRLPIVGDDSVQIRRSIEDGLEGTDMLISTGGVSVGDHDLIKDVWARMGIQMSFWKIRQKPGKPLAFGLHGTTPVIGLPGNPVSASVCFHLYVRPLLLKMMGATELDPPTVQATLTADIPSAVGRVDFARVILSPGPDGGWTAALTGTQSSGALRSMSLAHGLVAVEEEKERCRAGDRVRVELLDPHHFPSGR